MSGPRCMFVILLGVLSASLFCHGEMPGSLGSWNLRSSNLQDWNQYGANLPQKRTPNTPGIQTQTINGTFGKTESKSVKKGMEFIFVYSYNETRNKTTAVRVSVRAEDAHVNFPVLFVVRQQRHIISWQIPLLLENVYKYSTVNRTLCPLELQHRTEVVQKQQILIDVSSASENSTEFHLLAEEVLHFELQLEEQKDVEVTPSGPKYYQFTFPEGVNSVMVKVESVGEHADLCMVVSVQDIQCPVYDLVRNVEFTGQYQTVTEKGAITVTKDKFPSGAFFVVLVVKPSDLDCLRAEKIVPPDGNLERRKLVTVTVQSTINKSEYLWAVLGATAWFLLFYIIALFIAVIYHLVHKGEDFLNEPLVERVYDKDEITYSPERSSLLGSNPQTPVTGADDHPSYGATGGMLPAAEFSRSRNGIPHRISPEDDGDDSSFNEEEVDMLPDADAEKDVFRTKTFLYVSDLARKSRKKLTKKYRLYHWNLITIAIFYGLPVIQLVITYQKVLNVTGNEDICYYNFYCAHPLGVLSQFNNVFSNIGYVMLGILFLLLVARRDILYKRMIRQNERLDKYYGIPQHFGVFYAVGVALIMEGVLSGCYHVCPSYSNFQFDTSFMYMIGWLLMLKIYQTRHPDINPAAHLAYFIIACVIFIAVIGVVKSTVVFWTFYAVVHILLSMLLSIQIYYMGRWKLDWGLFHRIFLWLKSDVLRCTRPVYMDRAILLIIGNIVNWSFAIVGCFLRPDFAFYLLMICIVNLLMYFAFYIIMKLRSGERICKQAMVYIILAAVVWGVSLYFFMRGLTDWKVTPAQSRAKNQDCLLFSFYDDHDIWHFLSSMSLFLSFMTLLVLDDDLTYTSRDTIPVF